MTFENLEISTEMKHLLKKRNITQIKKIQAGMVPLILTGNDVVAQSETGSGKTLGFAIPIIEKLHHSGMTKAIVLAPTRELAVQIAREFEDFSVHKRLSIVCVYGGVSIENQVRLLADSDIVVGTPGRVLDMLRRRALDISRVDFFVLDEADRMLDMGFIEDIDRIYRHAPEKKQTIMLSATISGEIQRLSRRYAKNPEYLILKTKPALLKQYYYATRPQLKFSLLVHLLKKYEHKRTLIFCNSRRFVNVISENLRRNGIRAAGLSGDLSQSARERILEEFKSGKIYVLVATDVAARGLHVEDISHVYNYDVPRDADTYTHRIGRTARVGKSGLAVSLATAEDQKSFTRILEHNTIERLEVGNIPKAVFHMPERRYHRSERRFHHESRPQRGWHSRR